jgi:hypothetical protein
LCSELLLSLAEIFTRPNFFMSYRKDNDLIIKAKDMIHSSLKSSLSLDDICRELDISKGGYRLSASCVIIIHDMQQHACMTEVLIVTQNLIPGRDYPNTYREFREMFPNDTACASFLLQLRWPEGFVCPACGIASPAWIESRNRLECSLCHRQTYLTAGTIFDKTRTPLTIWFEAAWHLTTAKIGMSAKTLERTIGTSYEVAWMMLHRYRVAMVNTERSQLSGEVEVDESFVGGTETGSKRGRGTDKSIVAIAVEIKQPKGFGRVRWFICPPDAGVTIIEVLNETALCPLPQYNVHDPVLVGVKDPLNSPYESPLWYVYTVV